MLIATWILLVLLLGTMVFAVVRVGAEPRDRDKVSLGPVSEDTRTFVDARGTTDASTTSSSALEGSTPSRSIVGLYRHHSAAYYAWRLRQRTRQLQAARAQLRRRWHPTVDYALRLASAVAGVSYWQLREVSWCESTHNPFATNGRYKGIFQLGWSPFGFSPYDPVANALSAALTVKHDGSWRQWSCKP